jgi:hypothetical protein
MASTQDPQKQPQPPQPGGSGNQSQNGQHPQQVAAAQQAAQQQQQQAAQHAQAQQQLAAAMFASAAAQGQNPAQALQAHAAAAHAASALDIEAKARSLLNFDYDYPVKRKNFDHINDRELRKKLKNRESAQIARERAKAKMIQLERMVAELSEANRILEFENHRLKSRLCQVQGIRPNWQMQSGHPWSALMAQQQQQQQAQAQRQAAQAHAQSSQGNGNNGQNTFSHAANPNDPSCTQGTMTVKQEAKEQHRDGEPPHKIMALAGVNQVTSSSGASSESSSHRSSSSDSNELLPKALVANVKEEALNTITQHLLGLAEITNQQSSQQSCNASSNGENCDNSSKKISDSGAESDSKKASNDFCHNGAMEPDFNKIITDLKNNAVNLDDVTASLENKSSDAIFKDLINSLPL